MNYRVRLARKAQEDIQGIGLYVAYELMSPTAAEHQISRLKRAIKGLAQFPHRFRVYDKEPWKSKGLRVMPVDNYLVLYLPMDEKHIVDVVRVIYGKRDVDAQLMYS